MSKAESRANVWVMDLHGTRRRITSDEQSREGLAWSNNRELLVSSDAGGAQRYSIFETSEDGKIREVLATAGSLVIHDVSSDGRWLAKREESRTSLFAHRPDWSEDRDLSWLDNSHGGILSPRGDWIVFTEQSPTVGANYAVCKRDMDGSPVVRLGVGYAWDVSPDGNWVLATIPSLPPQLILYPTGTGSNRLLDAGSLESFVFCYFCPGGDSLIVIGAEPGKALRTYVLPLQGGGPRPVTPDGVLGFHMSPDGTKILARGSDESYAVYNVGGGKPTPVPVLTPDDLVRSWNPRANSALVQLRESFPRAVQRVDLDTGRREMHSTLDQMQLKGHQGSYVTDVSEDWQSYAYHAWWSSSALFLIDPPQ